MTALLNWLDDNLEGKDHFYYWYFELAFWCGCRPSEMLALRWSDIDWFNNTMRISKSRVRGIQKNVTKTHVEREVYLNDRSTRALQEIQKLGMSKDYVMICPETNEPFYGEETARNRLVDAMQACGIRHRPRTMQDTHVRNNVAHGWFEPCLCCRPNGSQFANADETLCQVDAWR